MNRYNVITILLLALISTFLLSGVVYISYGDLSVIFLFCIIALGLIVYDYLITARLKQSFGRFLTEVKQGNFESSQSNIIQKYDFVNLADIQVELSQMVGQIKADSKEQKKYIENVSHELMTPIAIIGGKLELLLQSPNIEKNDFKLINDILLKLDRLTKVNQSLVLLSKIDYNHYTKLSEVNIADIIDETLNLFEDQIRIDELSIRKKIEANFIVSINESLAYILIKNIIKNAIIHNLPNGHISIIQTDNSLTVSNSGKNIDTPTDKLFERFEVHEESSDSIGLGLSIIQKICKTNGIDLSYIHENGEHTIQLVLK